MSTTTISVSRETHRKLKEMGKMGLSFDEVINQLIPCKEEIDKFIIAYIKSKNGACIYETILGQTIVANHVFKGEGGCEKCGAIYRGTAGDFAPDLEQTAPLGKDLPLITR